VLAGSDRGYLRGGRTTIRRLGYVPDQALPALYADALALALASSYEGFGLPCLEAMACGIPVVAAARGALPETVGDAGLLVDPDDPERFTEAVLTAACDTSLRETLSARGSRRAASFTWKTGCTARSVPHCATGSCCTLGCSTWMRFDPKPSKPESTDGLTPCGAGDC